MDNRVHKDLLQASLWHFDERLRPALAGRRTFLLATGTAEQVERELLTALRRDLRRQRRRIVKDSPANGTSARVVRRLLGPTPLVAAGRRGAAMWPASDSPRKPCDRGDHGWTGRSTLVIDTGSIHGGRSAPTQPNRTLGPRDPYPEAYPDAAELLPSSELATRLSPSSREGCLLV